MNLYRVYARVAAPLCALLLAGACAHAQQSKPAAALTPEEIMAQFARVSTGNLADAVDEITGERGFMSHDMKPIFKSKFVGRAWTATLRRVLKNDKRTYPSTALQILDEAPAGSVIVYVLEDGLDIAGMGNLMATTAKARGLAGAVIDGGVRDIEEVTQIGFPVFSRSVTPATSVGRLVATTKNEAVICAGVRVRQGDYVVADWDGVVVVPFEHGAQAVELIRQYDAKESKMIPIIKDTKSMLKALEQYNRY